MTARRLLHLIFIAMVLLIVRLSLLCLAYIVQMVRISLRSPQNSQSYENMSPQRSSVCRS